MTTDTVPTHTVPTVVPTAGATVTTQAPAFASPADHATYGHYARTPAYPFRGRVTADGSSGFRAEPGRYHVYAAWTCPYAQRVAIVRKLKGLEDVVTLSYVDDERDGRGWAFRAHRGPDPVNGFTLLGQAYEATRPGYDGHLSVPVLWDRLTGRIVSNHFPDITIDLGTQFDAWARAGADLYPVRLRPRIDELNAWIYAEVNTGASRAALERLDALLGEHRFLTGDTITEADVRLWVSLARLEVFDLSEFEHLWGYARDLYRRPAFAETIEGLPDSWHQPHRRDR